MAVITRKYPDKSDAEIYSKVDEAMAGIARRHSLDYRRDAATRTGSVAKMGASGRYAIRDGEVTVELEFPFLIPSSMRRKVEQDIERRLDGLFA
jgi:hypothetical protein